MSFLIAIAVLAAGSPTYPWPIPNSHDRNDFEPYRSCVLAIVRKLAKSGGSASDIYEAADFECRDVRTRSFLNIDAVSHVPLTTDKGNEPYNVYEERFVNLITWLVSDLRGEVASVILEARSAK